APVIRTYSLSGEPGDGTYRVSVKREPQGVASSWLHTRLRVGDQLEVAAPRGTFVLAEAESPVLLLSAGVGATPVLAMLHALASAHAERQVWWLHGARSGRDHSFAAESRALLAALPNVRVVVCYSKPGPGDRGGRGLDPDGRRSASLLAELDLPRDADAYMCGPAAFMEEVGAALAALGLDAAHIHSEPFGPAAPQTPGIAAAPARTPHLPAGAPGTGPTVE